MAIALNMKECSVVKGTEFPHAHYKILESQPDPLKEAPGEPFEVRIRRFDSIRTHIARGHEWLSRATLTGEESSA